MATIGDMIETTIGSTVYDPATRAMVAGRPFTRRHYEIYSHGRSFKVQSVYAAGEYRLIVHVHGGRNFAVGSAETPTIDDAVSAALTEAEALGLSVGISERMTHATHMAAIDRAAATNDLLANTQIWD